MSWLDKFFSGGYSRLQVGGTDYPAQTVLNFASGATAADDPANGRTVVTIAAGGGVSTVSAAGIGTLASPGILRGIVGSASIPALHVGGFWSLKDAGGGSFIWDGTSTAADDGGTIIRPSAISSGSPGRWLRVFDGQYPAPLEWFGAKGDALKVASSTTGTDDAPAINTAIAWATVAVAPSGALFNSSRRLLADARKAYKCASPLNFDNTQGVSLISDGGIRYQNGCWLRFIGAMHGPLISAQSSLGFQLSGFQVDFSNVTWPTEDFSFTDVATMNSTPRVSGDVGKYCVVTTTDYTYADAATRLASAHVVGDVGKTATQTDTHTQWVIKQVVGTTAKWLPTTMHWRLATASPVLWYPVEIDGVDLGHVNWGGYTGPEGGDGSAAEISYCAFTGAITVNPGTHVIGALIRLHDGFSHHVYQCAFSCAAVGISGTDDNWGGGFSYVNHVERCAFFPSLDTAIYEPGDGWELSGHTFEGSTNIWGPSVGGALHYGGAIYSCFWSDTNTQTCIDLTARRGMSIQGNFILGNVGVRLNSCWGITSSGNNMSSNVNGYLIDPAPALALQDSALGPDYFPNTTYVSGTNYGRCQIQWVGPASQGLSWGSGSAVGSNSASFGDLCTATNTDAFSHGSLCVASGAQAYAHGVSCTASGTGARASGSHSVASGNYSVATGLYASAIQTGMRANGGGTVLGQGGSQSVDHILTKIITASSTQLIPNADGVTGPAIVGTARKRYRLLVHVFVTSENGAATMANTYLRYRVMARIDISGNLVFDTNTLEINDDPQASGIGAAAGTKVLVGGAAPNQGIDVQVQNTLAQPMNCTVWIEGQEIAT